MSIPDLLNQYWSEKYRPKTIDDMILDNKYKKKMQDYINKKEIPHMIFLGRPGTGKSTLARILTYSIISSDEDMLLINASEARGIDVVREKILTFMTVPPFSSKIKIVFLDEADYLTPEAFAALRSSIEDPVSNLGLKTRFLLTANYSSKIPDPIKSRMIVLNFDLPTFDDIYARCSQILEFENVTFDGEVLKSIINRNYPDMRQIISRLQTSVFNNILTETKSMTQLEQIKDIISKIFTSVDFSDIIKYRSELIDLLSNDYNANDIILWVLDTFIEDPLIHSIGFRYSTYAGNCIDDKHLILAMISDVILSKFSI